jgi:nicotinate-nucleotide adenylyltransferase
MKKQILQKRASLRIGIFGGTFDPPHIAHLIIAEQAVEELKLDVVYFIPAHIPPHKGHGGFVTAEHRWNMVRKAITGNKKFRASNIELKRKGISYTVDTLRVFKERYPASELFFIIGGDNYRQFHSWKSPKEILRLATIVVYHRPGAKLNSSDFHRSVVFLHSAMVDLSSTMIRERLYQKESITYLVSPAVERYINQQSLYQRGRNKKARK